MSRPIAAPGLVDTLRAQVAPRVLKRLDADPRLAEGWTWAADGRSVTTDTGETVRLQGEPVEPAGVACTCLLSPRCAHVLAVVSALPLSAGGGVEPAGPGGDAVVAAAAGDLQAAGVGPDAARSAGSGPAAPGSAGDPQAARAGQGAARPAGSGVEAPGSAAGAGAPGPLAGAPASPSGSPPASHPSSSAGASSAGRLRPQAAEPPRLGAGAAPEPVVLSAAQRTAAEVAWSTGRALLAVGALTAPASVVDDLARAAHTARAASLPRLEQAGRRLVRQLRYLREGSAAASSPALTEELGEWLLVAWALGRGAEVGADWVGEARRAYEKVGGLRVYGLCVEPVISSTSNGVLTWLCDDQGRLWSVAELRPDPAWRPRNTYGRGVSVGKTSISPKELCRAGLFLQDATASWDGRIGTGGGVVAARAGVTAWDQPPIATLFERPQDETAPLLFLRGVLLGVEGEALVLSDGQRAWRLVPALEHPELGGREALRLLARADGAKLAVIGKPRGHGVVGLLAAGGPDLRLPAELGGRLNLGLDRLLSEHLPLLSERAVEVVRPPELPDPADAIGRHRLRVALGGPGALPGTGRGRVELEARALAAAMRPTLAGALLGLADAAVGREPEALARAWLALTVAEGAPVGSSAP